MAMLVAAAFPLVSHASAYQVAPISPFGILDDQGEHAHAQYTEFQPAIVSADYGRGVSATITTQNECDRSDGLVIASWTGGFVDDDISLPGGRAQAGFVHLDSTDCSEAVAFSQMCREPCGPSDYVDAHYSSPIPVPDDGLPGLFRVVLIHPSTDNAEEPCLIRLSTGLPCPIMMTEDEYEDGVEVASDWLTVFAAADDEFCYGLTEPLASAYEDRCQAVLAAQLALDGEIATCPDPGTPALDSAWDVPACIKRGKAYSNAQNGQGQGQNSGGSIASACVLNTYFNGQLLQSYPAWPCTVFYQTIIEYEAAPPTGFTHTGPGSTDEASSYAPWETIGKAGKAAIPTDDRSWSTPGQATCPPYESKYMTAGGLITAVEIGPNIDGSNNRCDYNASAPGLGVLLIVAALASAAWFSRRKFRA